MVDNGRRYGNEPGSISMISPTIGTSKYLLWSVQLFVMRGEDQNGHQGGWGEHLAEEWEEVHIELN